MGRKAIWAVVILISVTMGSCGGPGPFTKALQGTYIPPTSRGGSQKTSSASAAKPEEHEAATDQVFEGTGEFIAKGTPAKPGLTSSGDQVTLDFEDADIREVLHAILGDVLKLNYVVDPSIEGKVTLMSSQPVAKDDVYPLLDQALALDGLTIVESQGVYSVVKTEAAHNRIKSLHPLPGLDGAPQGYGIWAVPLKYVSAAEMQKILEPFAPQGNIVRVDSARNLLLIAGTEREVETLLDTIATFDVDWMKGMSFGLLQVNHVDAQSMSEDLKEVFDAPDSPIQDMIRIIPLPRLNALLVISPRPEYIDQVQEWVARLDRERDKISRKIYVYHVQNGRAEDLVTSLEGILGSNDNAGGAPPADASQSVTQASHTEKQTGSGGLTSQSSFSSFSSRNAGLNGISGSEDTSFNSATDERTAGSKGGGVGGPIGSNGSRIFADDKNNAVLIYATASEYDLISDALRQLDTAPLQVLIEATIVEVGLNKDLNFGVEWFFQNGKHEIDLSATGTPAQVFPGFSYMYGGTNLKAVINTLASRTNVKVISSPQLMVVNNETARLQVGDEVPVPTQSAVSITQPDSPIVNSIEFKDSGVILSVTPRINSNGSVYMEIDQQVSDVVPNVTSGIDAPTFQQRKINSTVVVDDNETIVLGGLIRDSDTHTKSGIPILKDIPLLGLPFRNTVNSKRRTELLVFITPHVIHSNKDAQALSDYLRLRLDKEHQKGFLGIKFQKAHKKGDQKTKPVQPSSTPAVQ